MKKRLCILVLALCVMASFGACGTKDKEANTSTEAENEKDKDTSEDEDSQDEQKEEDGRKVAKGTRIVSVAAEDMDKYITLGEYKGIAVEEPVEEVTDAVIDQQIETTLSSGAVESEDENAVVKDGDIVNIDYEGKKDGVAFDGGTDKGYDLAIGSGSFIEGFEEGLIGCKKGETKDLNLTFPENYPSEELAGQEVVFTVKVNAIKLIPEFNDDWAKNNTEFDTAEEYRSSVADELKAANEEAARNTALNNAWGSVMDATEVIEYPKEDLDKAVKEYEDTLLSYAQQQNMEVDEFLESQQMTREQFDTQCKEYAEYMVKQDLVAQAIMDAEKMDLTDEECKAAEEELAQNYGVEDLSVLVQEFGEDTVNSSVALLRVTNFVIDNAKVKTYVGTEDGKKGFDADAAEAESAADEANNGADAAQ